MRSVIAKRTLRTLYSGALSFKGVYAEKSAFDSLAPATRAARANQFFGCDTAHGLEQLEPVRRQGDR